MPTAYHPGLAALVLACIGAAMATGTHARTLREVARRSRQASSPERGTRIGEAGPEEHRDEGRSQNGEGPE